MAFSKSPGDSSGGGVAGGATAALQTSGGQKTQIVDSVLGTATNVSLTGQLQTSIDPTEMFTDAFEGVVVDTTNRWNAAVTAGAGAVSQAASALTLAVGTGANAAAAISSQGTFATAGGSVRTFAVGAKLETTTIATGNYRFWGLGTPGTAYSTTNPIANGVGFEVTTAGVLRAVMYSSDVLVSSTNLTIPVDGIQHIYFFIARGNFVSFFMDASTIPVATIGLVNADISTLPIRFASLNAGSTTVGTPTLSIYGSAVIDNGRNANAISDGSYGWRKASVSAAGALSTSNAQLPAALGAQTTAASTSVNIASDQTVGTSMPDLFLTGQAAQTAAINNIIPATASANATDASGYRSASVQLICPAGTYTTGAVIFEGTNDTTNANWQTIPVWSQLILTGTPITAAITLVTTTSLVYTFPIQIRYIRARISTAVSGASASVQALTRLSQASWMPGIVQIAQATAANLNVTAATVTTLTTLTTLANGQTAHSAASTGSPLRVAGRVVTTLDTTLVQGDASDVAITSGQQLVTKEYASSENDWTYPAAASGISNTITAVTIKTAGAASIRNYVTSLSLMSEALGAATEVAIRDGAAGTVLWRTKIGTAGLPLVTIFFPNPLRGTAATLLEVITLSASVTGAVYFNATGYQSF